MAQAATSEEDYLKYYRDYVQQVFSLPYIVGYNKCQYVDDVQPKMLKQDWCEATTRLFVCR